MKSEDDPAQLLPAVSMSHISKSFSEAVVLDDVSFEVYPGEVHALAGGNGAGKSTLMKILRGVYTRDAGSVSIAGREYPVLTIATAREAGVGMVFQEFSLVPTMSVAENIFMGAESVGPAGFLDKRTMIGESKKLFDRLGVDIDPAVEISSLSTGYWQLTEIAKAMRTDVKVLVFDEPTAALSAAEIDKLFDIIGHLKAQGIAVIYISHRMDEIRRIADRITILRNGNNYLTRGISGISDEEIVRGIAGENSSALTKRVSSGRKPTEVLLDMRDVSTNGISGVNLQVKAGEVVGLAGLMGSGRTEVTRALFGIDRVTAGVISLRGRDYRPIGPKSAMNDGVALVPEDRRKQGLITSHSVQENLTINRLNENEVFGFLSNRKIETMAASLIRRFQIKVNRPKSAAARLSGGNQQKIVISKWLGREPDLLILDEPTAGVDIGTKNEVLREVSRYAEQGKGVLFISSEFQEMIAICDRYYIMKNGTVVGTVGSDDINDEADLMLAIAHTDPKRRAIDNQIEE